ncbi:histone-lysine N-methyltransferase SETMAR [Electrophorus electricus]|uniref:Histone-lysine N-methyltransferase SETMAR n=1 Tax=Electrophorus electricus TaxID=8005 RepID=A0A4W4F918_ELEEL|nr:histone-lysine N-methyltransferase SETMAR [Electrophorus electricus]
MMRLYAQDISNGLENVPVLIENNVSEGAFPKFKYSPENVQGPGCDVDPSEVTLPGCSCHSLSCPLRGCPCTCYGQAYTSEGLLSEQQQDPATGCSHPVFECNVLCMCSDSCQSRLVQHGVRMRLGVFRTKSRGWGVQALEAVPRGRFVCEYAGEVLGFSEALRRQLAQTPAHMNYVIAVQEHGGVNGVCRTFVDPAAVGNVGRFLNHSCRPNLDMVPVRVHSLVPRLALFAARDIEAGEELTFDYSGGHARRPETTAAAEQAAAQRKACLCGAPNCTGFLPLDISVLHGPE